MRPYSRYTSHRSTTDTVTFDTTDALIVRPYSRYSSHRSTTDAVTFDTTDAQIVRPDGALLGMRRSPVGDIETIADHSVTLSAPELRLDVLSYYLCTVYLF